MPKPIDDLNFIGNPRFADGKQSPRGWQWTGPKAIAWSREPGLDDQPVMTLRCDNAQRGALAGWSRRVRAGGDEHYHVEMIVSGDVDAAAENAGLVLRVQPLQGGQALGHPFELTAPPRLDRPTLLRAYLHTPPGTRSVELTVGLHAAAGWVRVHEVLMLSILDPESKSHVHASVPPPAAYPPPRSARRIAVCTAPVGRGEEARPRPIVDLLTRRFGPRAVGTVSPKDFDPRQLDADALLLPDATPPRGLATLTALQKIAQDRVVVISLPAFASLAGPAVDVRTVEQADDPIHAKVAFANFITRGFALDDVFPFSWRGPDLRRGLQRHFRRNPAFREFCERRGFEVILESVCEADATSDKPVCLYHATPNGAIVVLDVEPAESVATNFDEPDLAFFLLTSVLGVEQNTLGQYITPARSEKELRGEVAEMGVRYPELTVRGDASPDTPRRDQFIELGGEPRSFGLPIPPRPLILIRTGLRGDDADGIYGTMLWFKHLVRPQPYPCPYVLQLLAKYRFAWIPLCAEYHPGQGWCRPDDLDVFEMAGEFEASSVAAVIDVTATDTRNVRVLVSTEDTQRRFADLLPGLSESLGQRRFFYRSTPDGRHLGDRYAMDWRWEKLTPEVAKHNGEFDTDFHRRAVNAGATLIRLEFPQPPADLTAGSIWRTDLVGQTLEQTVGLLYGWIAMNRQSRPVDVRPPNWNSDTRAHLLSMQDGEAVATPLDTAAGRPVKLEPACALCIDR